MYDLLQITCMYVLRTFTLTIESNLVLDPGTTRTAK